MLDMPRPESCMKQFRAKNGVESRQQSQQPPALNGFAERVTPERDDEELELRGERSLFGKPLPNDVTARSRLTSLSVVGCRISSLPPTISKLGRLRHLNVDDNKLTEFPAEIAALDSLCTLSAKGNMLKALPSNLDFDFLTTLNLSGNNLQDVAPCVFRFTSLTELDLQDNSSITTLPEHIGLLTCLRKLSLQRTGLQRLPHDLCLLPLTDLHLGGCALQEPWSRFNDFSLYIDSAPALIAADAMLACTTAIPQNDPLTSQFASNLGRLMSWNRRAAADIDCSDCTVNADTINVPAHSCMLLARCPGLRETSLKVGGDSVVGTPALGRKGIRALLAFVYSNVLPSNAEHGSGTHALSSSELHSVATVATAWGLPALSSHCRELSSDRGDRDVETNNVEALSIGMQWLLSDHGCTRAPADLALQIVGGLHRRGIHTAIAAACWPELLSLAKGDAIVTLPIRSPAALDACVTFLYGQDAKDMQKLSVDELAEIVTMSSPTSRLHCSLLLGQATQVYITATIMCSPSCDDDVWVKALNLGVDIGAHKLTRYCIGAALAAGKSGHGYFGTSSSRRLQEGLSTPAVSTLEKADAQRTTIQQRQRICATDPVHQPTVRPPTVFNMDISSSHPTLAGLDDDGLVDHITFCFSGFGKGFWVPTMVFLGLFIYIWLGPM